MKLFESGASATHIREAAQVLSTAELRQVGRLLLIGDSHMDIVDIIRSEVSRRRTSRHGRSINPGGAYLD